MPGTQDEWDSLAVCRNRLAGSRGLGGEPSPAYEGPIKGFDPVDRPGHYNTGGIEAIEYIKQQLGHDGFIAYCEGNAIKYGHRWRYKNGVEDLKKKKWYLERMIEEVEKGK